MAVIEAEGCGYSLRDSPGFAANALSEPGSRFAAASSIRAESGGESEVRSESLRRVPVLAEPQGNGWFKYCENLYQHRK